jgi:hypothetical protein
MKAQRSGESFINTAVNVICNRSLSGGGFAMFNGGSYRTDATAWAVLALESYGMDSSLSKAACKKLAESQLSDGRIPVIEEEPKSFWPTTLAILAWRKIPGFETELELAVDFLLGTAGLHAPKTERLPESHDTSIKGWPWIENTHSWVEPTSLAILALKACGYENHERVLEAVRMILDRQLPAGGWNYGNTVVFGKQLMPIQESTGHALCALAGFADTNDVISSINYLKREVDRIRTPLTLSWSILGLTAWSNRPVKAGDWISESLALQKKYGNYDTALLAQLIIAYFATYDFLSSFLE